jgi:uncharacterized membrane protein
MQSCRFHVIVLALLLPLVLVACGGGGSRMETQQEIRTTTTGQELTDLKKALDNGAITREEYERERRKILNRSR